MDFKYKAEANIEVGQKLLEAQVNAEFDQWFDENGLERAMGVVIRKQQN